MKLYRISFREAVEMLAARAGIAISKKISSSPALNHKQKGN
jgi:DNA primase